MPWGAETRPGHELRWTPSDLGAESLYGSRGKNSCENRFDQLSIRSVVGNYIKLHCLPVCVCVPDTPSKQPRRPPPPGTNKGVGGGGHMGCRGLKRIHRSLLSCSLRCACREPCFYRYTEEGRAWRRARGGQRAL